MSIKFSSVVDMFRAEKVLKGVFVRNYMYHSKTVHLLLVSSPAALCRIASDRPG